MGWRRSKTPEESRRLREAYLARGQCACSRPLVEGRSRCAICLTKIAAAQARRRAGRAPGECRDCGRPSEGKRCARCAAVLRRAKRKAAQATYYHRKQAGLCVACGGPARPDRTTCEEHARRKT